MTQITTRREWIARMDEAGKDQAACWIGFYDACVELSNVAATSVCFSAKERKAAIALEVVARVEGGLSDIMKREFMDQHKILGAPGYFGYDTNEGRSMQAVYEWFWLSRLANSDCWQF